MAGYILEVHKKKQDGEQMKEKGSIKRCGRPSNRPSRSSVHIYRASYTSKQYVIYVRYI